MLLDLKSNALKLAAGLGLGGGILLGAASGAVLTVAAPTQAVAQGFFDPFGFEPPRKVRRTKPANAQSRQKQEKFVSTVPERAVNGPLVLNVSIKKQRISVYDRDGLVAEAPVSTGMIGHATPTGVFTIIEKNKVHFSNLYNNAPMPNMQRITRSGVALHAGALPGYPASHGCIRLPHGFSSKLFGMTTLGTRVIVSRDPVAPNTIDHERLFAALPPDGEAASSASAPLAIGIEVADASNSTVPQPDMLGVAPMTRPTFRETWKTHMAELAAAIAVTEVEKGYAFAAAAAAARSADQALANLKAAKAEAARADQAVKTTLGEKKATQQKLVELARKVRTAKKLTENDLKKAAATEDKLEAELFDLTMAAEAAPARAAKAKEAIAAAEANAKRAAEAKRSAADAYGKAKTDHLAAIEADAAAKRRDAKRPLPVSVFVSRATQRLYVRQGYEPIFDIPVTFTDPEKPIGTHVFTALDYKPGKTAMNWTVASVPFAMPSKSELKPSRKNKAAKAEPKTVVDAGAGAPQTAASALERLDIPVEAREQIADVMKPGSSFVISDYGISHETGKYTDFIILTR